jgi:hypothetical protein
MGLMGVGVRKQQQKEEKRVQEEKPIEVSASEVVSAYRENKAAADNKFKGKVVQVTGTVEKIERGYAVLKAERGFVGDGFDLLSVHLRFKDESKLATLSRGQPITVKGICTGVGLFDAIVVEQCVVVQ